LQNLNAFLDSEAERLAIDDVDESSEKRDLREIGGKEDSGEIGVIVSALQDDIRTLCMDGNREVRAQSRVHVRFFLLRVLFCAQGLFGTCTQPNSRSFIAQVRVEAFHILRKVLQQGLVLPVQCITQLIALTSDPDPKMRAQALGQLSQVLSFLCSHS
jgi:hypothetical protein